VGVRGWVRGRRHRPFPGWRLAAWLAGLGLVWLATASPLAGLDRALLTAHMLKHLVLMTVAAPLLLVSEPRALLRWGLGPDGGAIIRPTQVVSASGLEETRVPAALAASGRVLTHPALCWLAGTATVLAWHVPAAMSFAMHSAAGHALQSASFLLGGLLFWWPVVEPWPARPHWTAWMVPLYLLLATLPCDALSAFLAFCGRPVYAAALSAAPPEQLLADQERAGALMWVWVTLVYLVPAVWQLLRLLGPTVPESAQPQSPGGTKLSW
jgi:cytochrome c oxidase assembly factor CtaG